MDQLKIFLDDLWSLLARSGLSEHQILGIFALFFLFGLVLKTYSLLRRRRVPNYYSMISRIDHLSIQVADLQSQLSRHLATVESEKKKRDNRDTGRALLEESSSKVFADRGQGLSSGSGSALVSGVSAQGKSGEDILGGQEKAGGIFAGLKKTRDAFKNRLAQVFGAGKAITPQTLEELEELLISSDLGVRATGRLLEGLALEAKARGSINGDEAKAILKNRVKALLGSEEGVEIEVRRFNTKPVVILIVGVNGVGKTTTIGKLARVFVDQGLKVTLAACDTFRAAAVEQIRVWGERAGVEVVSGDDGAKPTTVLYQAIEQANARGDDVIIVDTAGRLHTRVNLMNELGSIVSMIERLVPGAPHEALLILDAATGQNALEQAKEFGKKVKLSGLVITKLDGTPKGGIVVAIKEELGIPIRYIGVGEGTEDLRVFHAEEFVEALFDDAPEMYRGEQKRQAITPAGLVH